jgi:hypothetical protein
MGLLHLLHRGRRLFLPCFVIVGSPGAAGPGWRMPPGSRVGVFWQPPPGRFLGLPGARRVARTPPGSWPRSSAIRPDRRPVTSRSRRWPARWPLSRHWHTSTASCPPRPTERSRSGCPTGYRVGAAGGRIRRAAAAGRCEARQPGPLPRGSAQAAGWRKIGRRYHSHLEDRRPALAGQPQAAGAAVDRDAVEHRLRVVRADLLHQR